jgi:hypothetical protein
MLNSVYKSQHCWIEVIFLRSTSLGEKKKLAGYYLCLCMSLLQHGGLSQKMCHRSIDSSTSSGVWCTLSLFFVETDNRGGRGERKRSEEMGRRLLQCTYWVE